MKERVFNYEEFTEKVDRSKPIHYAVFYKCVDPEHGVLYRVWFTVSGVSRDGHVVEFYVEKTTTAVEPDLAKTEGWLRDLEAKYAKPLGATPGEWIYHKAFQGGEDGCV